MSITRADRLIGLLGIGAGDRVLDVGCGRGAFLNRVMEATGATGVGVDLDGDLIDAARKQAARQCPKVPCDWITHDMSTFAFDHASFDAAICLGSSHVFGLGDDAFVRTLGKLMLAIRPGGRILIGEGYWKQTPDPAYVKVIGEPTGIAFDHRGNIDAAESLGLITLDATTSTRDEWDEFEWGHRRRFVNAALASPGDDELQAAADRHQVWRDAYLKWGRSTMGFGFYVFTKAGS